MFPEQNLIRHFFYTLCKCRRFLPPPAVSAIPAGQPHAIHNAEVMKVGEDVMANLKQACADLKADAANDQTTLAERHGAFST